MMTDDVIDDIFNNISASIMLFPAMKDGYIPFKLINNLESQNNSISFSVALRINKKKDIEGTAYLKLVKYNNARGKYKTFLLEEIPLNDKEIKPELIYSNLSVPDNETIEKNYLKINSFTFFFDDIPILDKGRYAIGLLVYSEKGFRALTSYYFNVV